MKSKLLILGVALMFFCVDYNANAEESYGGCSWTVGNINHSVSQSIDGTYTLTRTNTSTGEQVTRVISSQMAGFLCRRKSE